KKLLHVQSTLEYEGNGVFTRKNPTKTSAGIRWIELDDETLNVLLRWRSIQVENGDDSYVLARFGKPLNKCTLSRILKRQAKKAGVEVITGKGLRHSHDSFLINVLGKDVLYVSKRSGRVDKATTLNTYSHLYDSKKASGGREISQALHKFGVSSNPTKTPLN
ncbi:tyrosine-type recombinase/integrase, partial [Streptococcus agalactiae]